NPPGLRTTNAPSPNVYSGNGAATGRILLAAPASTGNPLQDALYSGWLYAAVVTGTAPGVFGHLEGLYLTKDFGVNSAKMTFPSHGTASPGTNPPRTIHPIPTNDTSATKPVYDVGGGGAFSQGNYDLSLAIDPTNPYVVYLGGTRDGQDSGMLRVDTSKL